MKKWYAVAQDKVKMQVPVNISQPVLQWVFTQIKFKKLSSEIQKYLNWWKNGEKTPTLSQVEKVSKATYIPLGYFFQKILLKRICLLSSTAQLIAKNCKIQAEN